MNTYKTILTLTFLNTLIALLGYPFPFWFDRWFTVISGALVIYLLLRKASIKGNNSFKNKEEMQQNANIEDE